MYLKKSISKFAAVSCSLMMLSLSVSGCGSKPDPALEAYKESMTEFYDKLTYYDSSINAIDPEADGAKGELLGYLDQMNDTYKTMASLTIPEEFSGISDIAVEAADYMQKADEFYHMAYDNDFDPDSEELASQYYERANNRAVVMLQVLHGEVPEGEGITVETESTYEFSTVGDEESETEQEGSAETETETETEGSQE